MAETILTYVEMTSAGGWRVAGSRVSLDSVIHLYNQGSMPRQIVEEFPTLSMEQVHGAIAFYLHNQAEIDTYFKSQRRREEELRQQSESDSHPQIAAMRQTAAERLRGNDCTSESSN